MKIVQGSAGVVDYALYGWDSERDSVYREKLDRLSNVLTGVGKGTLARVKDVYNRYSSDSAIRKAKRLLRKREAGFNENIIRAFRNTSKSNAIMRRYIMANRKVDELFVRGILDGFSNKGYVDTAYDRQVLRESVYNGIVDTTGEKDTEILHDMSGLEYEEELTIEDQNEIFKSWKYATEDIDANIDPTDS